MMEGIRGWEGCRIESGREVNIDLARSSDGKQEEELEGRGGNREGGGGEKQGEKKMAILSHQR